MSHTGSPRVILTVRGSGQPLLGRPAASGPEHQAQLWRSPQRRQPRGPGECSSFLGGTEAPVASSRGCSWKATGWALASCSRSRPWCRLPPLLGSSPRFPNRDLTPGDPCHRGQDHRTPTCTAGWARASPRHSENLSPDPTFSEQEFIQERSSHGTELLKGVTRSRRRAGPCACWPIAC